MANPSLRWSPIVQFISEAGRWAVASAVAAVISAGLGIWEHATDHPVSAFIWLCLSVPLFWTGAGVVVAKQRKALEGMKAEIARLKAKPEGPEMWLSFQGKVIGERVLRITNVEGGTARDVQLQEMTDGELVSDKSEVIPFLGIKDWYDVSPRVRTTPALGFEGIPFSLDALLTKAKKPIRATINYLDANGAPYTTVFQITPDPYGLSIEIRQLERSRS